MLGLGVAVVTLIAYGFATQGWIVYLIVIGGSLGGIAGPAVQGLISRGFAANEQGSVQGALTSLTSIAGILGPALATRLFGYFIGPQAPARIPGAAFFFSSLLMLLALVLSAASFRFARWVSPAVERSWIFLRAASASASASSEIPTGVRLL